MCFRQHVQSKSVPGKLCNKKSVVGTLRQSIVNKYNVLRANSESKPLDMVLLILPTFKESCIFPADVPSYTTKIIQSKPRSYINHTQGKFIKL